MGEIVRVNDCGFGFLRQPGGGRDIFFHARDFVREEHRREFDDSYVGDFFRFDVVEEADGRLRAANLRRD